MIDEDRIQITMNDSSFEIGSGIDSRPGIISTCANCCTSLLHNGSENEGIEKLKIKSNLSDVYSEIQIWYALEFIYGVSWKSIRKQLKLENRSPWLSPQDEITLCNHCASLLTENYSSHQSFEESCHSSSLVKKFRQKSCLNIVNLSDKTGSSHSQEEIDRDEKAALVDDFEFHEDDDTIESQIDSVETKYDPMSPLSDNTINAHITSSIDSKKSNASPRRESLRSHKRHIKIEQELSDEKIFHLINANGNKSKRSHSKKVRIDKKYIGKRTFGSLKSLSKRKNKSVRKITEVIPQQRGSRKTNNSKLFQDKVNEDIEQNTKQAEKRLSKRCVCNVCGKVYHNSHSLYCHRRNNHEGINYPCTVCGRTMNSKESLTNHTIRKHASEDEKNKWRTSCKRCGDIVFTFALSIHFKNSCKGTPRVKEKYTCDQCGRVYNSLIGLQDHASTHSEEPKQCDICSKVCLTSKRLLSHKKTVHAEKKFTCQICPAAFALKGQLNNHQYIHAESRKFVCEICGTTYKNPQHLRNHLKLHKEIQEKGVGAFTCDICNDGKTYAHSKSLKDHNLLKHGTKIYQCSYCGKRLSCGFTLRQHEALHKELPDLDPRSEMKGKGSRNVLSELPSTEEKTKLHTNETNN